LDTTGPRLVTNYEKEKNACDYTITFTTANNGQTSKVQIFRSTEKSFTANASTLVVELPATPNQDISYTDTVPNCDLEYFYAVRSVDDANNSSPFVADTLVTVTPDEADPNGNGDDGEVQGSEDNEGEN